MKIKMTKTMKSLVATTLALGLFTTQTAQAHRLWVKPSTTVVSGEEAWVTFDAAVANTIFFPDHFALGLDNFNAVSPSGKAVELQNKAKLKYRSVFDLQLNEQGTYRVYSASNTLMAFWKDEEGNRKMWPGRGKTGTIAEFHQQVPKTATDLNVVNASRRVEVFVSLGEPSNESIKPTGQGIELAPITHPTDLYTGETAQFKLILDGEAIEGAQITLVKEGEKYRDDPQVVKLTTDANGQFEVNFDDAGQYWLEAEYSDKKAKAPAKERRATYVAVFEVQSL